MPCLNGGGRCPYCGHRCNGATCRYDDDLPALDTDDLRKPSPTPPKPRKRLKSIPRARATPRGRYEVTADARILCACGSYVYTERINGGPARFPDECWRCGTALTAVTDTQ